MTTAELDETYTVLAETTNRVGEANASVFLAMLTLSLLSRHGDVSEARELIRTAEQLSSI
ncbi:MAG: hypothetical protein V4451_21370 [Pseudomonadota bacterium]